MKRGLTGYYQPITTLGESCRAFIPHPLPPDPALVLDERLQALAQDAALALGRLDGISSLLPEPTLFLYSYIRKEAVLSSQIEGTQSSLSDLLLYEAEGSPGVPVDDVREVSNCVAALIKAALAHVQFEPIHPFLDGNGRVGRLLITFLFQSEGVLRHPMLYLSLYFKENRTRYYDLLQAIRDGGDWEEWVEFFLEGVAEVAAQAVSTAGRLLALFQEHQRQFQLMPRTAGSALRVLDHLQRHPVTSVQAVVDDTGMAFHTAQRMLITLQKAGVVNESTGKKYGRLYTYTRYVEIMNEE